MVGKHDWGCLGQGERDEFGGQLRETLGVLGGDFGLHAECGMGDDVSGEVFEGTVNQGECDGGIAVRGHGPVALVVAYGTSVERVFTVILVLGNMIHI